MNLAAATAWAGHDKEAQEAVVKLRTTSTGLTIQTSMRNISGSLEGLRKAGLPEGGKSTN